MQDNRGNPILLAGARVGKLVGASHQRIQLAAHDEDEKGDAGQFRPVYHALRSLHVGSDIRQLIRVACGRPV
jgi:hypothetical protein